MFDRTDWEERVLPGLQSSIPHKPGPEAPQGGAGAPRDAVIIPPLTRTIYCWVNSSGISVMGSVLRQEQADWRQQLDFLDPRSPPPTLFRRVPSPAHADLPVAGTRCQVLTSALVSFQGVTSTGRIELF